MDKETAEYLLRSLLGRLVLNGSSFSVPDGILSAEEAQAIGLLARAPSVSKSDDVMQSEPLSTIRSEKSAKIRRALEEALATASRLGPSEADIRLCLDFGTAMSKAWAQGERRETIIPLSLGGVFGKPSEYAVPSSIFISNSGRIYFGAAADTQYRSDDPTTRLRFQNIKQLFSDQEIDQDLSDILPDGEIDPTKSGLTFEDLLTLYLAWLTSASYSALEHALSEAGDKACIDVSNVAWRCLARRFAVPCFEDAREDKGRGLARAKWAQGLMKTALARAHVLAIGLAGYWEGLTTVDAKLALDLVRHVQAVDLSGVFAAVPSIKEPLAAGASRFEEFLEDSGVMGRRTMMVIDAGAGTTDFACFSVAASKADDTRARYAFIPRSVRMCRIAGNAVDEALRPVILRVCGIDPITGNPRSQANFKLISRDLDSRIREIKQELVLRQEAAISLLPDVAGKLNWQDFVDDPSYTKMKDDLFALRKEVVSDIFEKSHFEYVAKSNGLITIRVLLTGGSSNLPFVRALSDGEEQIQGAKVRFVPVTDMPAWIKNMPRETSEVFAAVYPQMAVAVGGAAPILPEESDIMLSGAVTPGVPGPRQLERFQTKGI